MQLFDAILENTNIKDAAKELGVQPTDIHGMLLELGVQHEKGQKYKHAVLNFLAAGGPYQYDLFREAPSFVPSRELGKRLKKEWKEASLLSSNEPTLVNSIGLEKI